MPNPLPRLTRVLDALETHRLVVERDVSEIERAQAALVAEAERTRQRIAGLTLWTSEDPRVDAALANLAHHTGVRLNAQLQHQVKRAQAHEREITDPARERRREANIRVSESLMSWFETACGFMPSVLAMSVTPASPLRTM